MKYHIAIKHDADLLLQCLPKHSWMLVNTADSVFEIDGVDYLEFMDELDFAILDDGMNERDELNQIGLRLQNIRDSIYAQVDAQRK